MYAYACARHTLSGPRYIPNSLHMPLPSSPFITTLFFTLPYILPTLGGTRMVVSRGLLPEPDNCRQN